MPIVDDQSDTNSNNSAVAALAALRTSFSSEQHRMHPSRILRIRRPLFFLLVILIINLTVYLLFRPFPRIESFVQNTNQKIRSGVNVIHNLSPKEFAVDESYLEYLGFYDSKFKAILGKLPSSSPNSFIVATSVASSNYELAFDLLESVRSYLGDSLLVLIDVGLHLSHINKLKKKCNATSYCKIRPFEFEKFPDHVGKLHINAFKPLAIQILLHDYVSIIWTDLQETPYYFVRDKGEMLPVLQSAKRVGIQGWGWRYFPPTSYLTHPNTFTYLHTSSEAYYFHRMISSARLIIHYNKFVRDKVMLPWVKCALNVDCWQPIGARDTGCSFNRVPYMTYSGCHFFDMSALNVVLGMAYNFNTSAYECKMKVFGLNSNDTDLYNHDLIPGLNIDALKRNLGISVSERHHDS